MSTNECTHCGDSYPDDAHNYTDKYPLCKQCFLTMDRWKRSYNDL